MKTANRTKPKTDFGIEVRVFTAQTGMTVKELAERAVHHAGGNHHGPLCWAPAHSRGSGVHAELPEGGVIVAAKAKINTARDLFYFSDDIMRITGFSQSKSYKIIKQMNKELEAQGKLTFEGRVSKRYFNERLGLDVDTRQKSRA